MGQTNSSIACKFLFHFLEKAPFFLCNKNRTARESKPTLSDRIFYAWEIGQDLGHVARFAPIVWELRKHHVHFSYALTDLSRCYFLQRSVNDCIYQAPCCTALRGQVRENLSYPQTLINHGFLETDVLASRMVAWMRLFAIEHPKVVICDFAPVAQIVAQSMGIPTVMLGTSFECPPAESPMPPFTSVERHLQPAIFEDQILVDHCMAESSRRVGLTPTTLAKMIKDSKKVFLCTYPELGCYGPHRNVSYYGTWNISSGKQASFTSLHDDKIFCYLKFRPGVEYLVGSLHGLDADTLIFIDGASKEFIDWFSSPNVRFLDSPADIATLASDLSLAVTNGNHGTTSLLLSLGTPVLMMPLHIEQTVHAKRAEMSGLGVTIDQSRICDFAKVVKGMLADSSLKQRTMDFSSKSEKYRDSVSKIANEILTCL